MMADQPPLRSGVIWFALVLTTLLVEACYRIGVRMSSYEAEGAASMFIAWYIGCVLAPAPLYFLIVSRAAKRRSEAALETAQHENLESVGVLVDTVSDGESHCERQCREALVRLLPLLNGENAHLLDEYRQAKLRYIVWPPASPIYSTYLARLSRNRAQSIVLRIAIIEALSRVGDSEALTMFDEMLGCRACTVNERRIQQVVRESRHALLSRVATEPARQSLLRPAKSADTGSLVRIPSIELGMPPEELLHVRNE